MTALPIAVAMGRPFLVAEMLRTGDDVSVAQHGGQE
jgi:hypothetical protein